MTANSSADSRSPLPPAEPSAQLPTASAPAPAVSAPTALSPPLAHALEGLDVTDGGVLPSAAAQSGVGPAMGEAPPSSKRRRESTADEDLAPTAGVVKPTAPPPAKGHKRSASGRSIVAEDGAVEGGSLASFRGEETNGAAGGAEKAAVPPSAQAEKAKDPPPRLSPLQTQTSSARGSPSIVLPVELPSFPVLPASQPTANQTFQTASQVSSILSLPPPLLLQLARTDSPQEQREIAAKGHAGEYLSSMAIPPPSPTTMVDEVRRAGLSIPGSSAPSSSASSASTPAVDTAPSHADLALALAPPLTLPPLSSLLAAVSAPGGHPAIPLLLGQGFSPPTPGVLAPIPGIPGVGEALRLAIGPPLSATVDGEKDEGFKPKFASVEEWSYRKAKEQVFSTHSTSATPSSAPSSSAPARPPLHHASQSFTDREVASLAQQLQQWALAEQEKQVEQHVVEARSAAVLLAAQAAAASANSPSASPDDQPAEGPAGAGGHEVDVSEYAEAYKKQLNALASGYFAQLHRDALERLTEASSASAAPPPSSAAPALPPAPALSSSQAPTLTSLTSLTSSRPRAEAMHVRASAAAAVAAQVMAAKDLARSAGERLVSLGAAGDARRVVEEVRGEVEAQSRRGSSGEMGAQKMKKGDSTGMMSIEEVGVKGSAPLDLVDGTGKETGSPAKAVDGEAEKMAIESVGAVPPPSSAVAGAAQAASLPAAGAPSSSSAALPHAAPAAPAGPGDLTNPTVLASVASPSKRDYLLQYAHALYAKDAASAELLPLLHTIESVHPDHLPTLLLISCVYYTRGELESSLYYNKRLLAFDPTYVEAMSNIGTTLRAMGKWAEAETWWWKAIKLRPTYWDATENLLGVLCNPTPQATPEAAAVDPPPAVPRYADALALCDYVESQIFAPVASLAHPAVPPTPTAFHNPLASLPRPRPLPPTVPFNHVHRLQNLFYAKGNLRLALGDSLGAQDEYEKAVEVALSMPEWAQRLPYLHWPLEGCTTRDLIVAATVIGKILAAYAQGQQDPTLVSRTAAQLGVADDRGGVPFERIFRVVKAGGDAYVANLLEMGGGVLPTVLLEPQLLAQLPMMLFPESRGSLPALLDPVSVTADPSSAAAVDPQRKAMEASAKQTTSTMLLTLAKILQDSLAPTSATRCTVGGLPASQSLLLPFYYVALALYPSPSTCNNLGILLSTLNATTLIGNQDPSKPPIVLTGQQLALRYYQTGLKLDARHPHLYTNLGSLLKDMGELAKAVEMYKRAVEFNPTFDVALANLANAVKDTGQIQESIPYYREAVRLNPNFPEAICGLVNALGGVCDWQGRGGVGEEWLVDTEKRLIHIPEKPNHPLPRQGYMQRISDLVAKQLKDGYSYGIGSLKSYGSLQDWLVLIAAALYGTTPHHAGEARMQPWAARLGFLLGDYDHKRKLVNEGGYLIRLVERLMRRIQRRWYIDEFGKAPYLPPSVQELKRIEPGQQDLAKYRRPPLPPSLPPIPVATVLPFHCFTLPVTARETRLISHRTGLRISHATLNQPWMPPIVYPPPRPPLNGKINVGYVSSDLGNHPLSHLMQSVFGYHDTSRFNIFVYATSPSDKSPYRLKIEQESQHFVDCSRESTQQIVDRIVRDEIHVLINLSGYTKGARNEVFAARPSPVQMSYMGFASTLSAGWCDYFIVDPIVCPPQLVSGNQWRYWAGAGDNSGPRKNPAATDFEGDLDPEGDSELFVYTEKLIYLPHSYFVTDHKQAWREDESVGLKPGEPPVTSTLPPSEEVSWALEEEKRQQMRKQMFPNIREDTLILANWNQLYKIDPFIFRIWLNILRQHPNSILWLLRFPAPGEQHLKDTALRWAGQDVADRVVFTDVANKNEHIHRGRICDLFLDTTECNAHTTAADILWSGTPILTFPRHMHKMCSRVAASIAVATGFGPQMIVSSAEEYERRALELAAGLVYEKIPADPSKPPSTLEGREQRRAKGELAELRKKLFLTREQSPLFDTKRWVRNLEKGLVTAWERWVNGQEFEDSPEWGQGPERSTASIWIEDDADGANIAPRKSYF